EGLDDLQHQCISNADWAADLHFAGRRIGQEFNVPDALLELIEGCRSALEQGLPEYRRLDALRTSVEKPNTERMLQICNDLRYCRLRDAKLQGSLRHAPTLHHGEERMKIAQPELPADLALPVDPPGHMSLVIPLERKREFLLLPRKVACNREWSRGR